MTPLPIVILSDIYCIVFRDFTIQYYLPVVMKAVSDHVGFGKRITGSYHDIV